MNYFSKKPWIFPTIGSLITIIALFTPVTLYTGRVAYVWMNQLALELYPFHTVVWRYSLPLFIASILLMLIIFTCSITVLILTNIYRKASLSFKKLKWKWLILSIIIILATLTWIIMMEIWYAINGDSHWELYLPLFGIIGPFIGASFIIGGTIFIKHDNIIEQSKKITFDTSVNFVKRNAWVISIIGGIITMIGLFSPTALFRGEAIYVWMNQIALEMESRPIEPTLWRTGEVHLISITFSVIIFTSSIILIVLTNVYRKNSLNFLMIKWKWITLALFIILSTLGWILMMILYYLVNGEDYWLHYYPYFGIIGPFIGAGIILVGSFLIKNTNNRKS